LGNTTHFPEPLTGVAEIKQKVAWDPLRLHPVQVTGVVTLFDPSRNLVVLQDKDGPLAFELGDVKKAFRVGQLLRIEAGDAWPFMPNLARYPDRPDNIEVLPKFEWELPNQGGFFVARYRALLKPPTTGMYRFFLSSDDSSRLLLSTDASPENRAKIASVSSFTRLHDWSRTPPQHSVQIELEQGRSYYLEAVHHQAGGPSHLAVAWEGPGVPLSVIDSSFLQAWQDEHSAPSLHSVVGRPGVLFERWQDVPVTTPDVLIQPRRLSSVLSVRRVVFTDLGEGKLPTPDKLIIGQSLPEAANFAWAEIEGTVDFAGTSGALLRLELSDGGKALEVFAQDRSLPSPQSLRGRRIRVVGAVESTWSQDNPNVVGRLWLQPRSGLVVTEHAPQAEVARLAKISELMQPDASSMSDTAVKFRGRVVAQTGNALQLSDDGVFHGFISQDGSNWTPVGAALDNEMPSHVHIGFAVNSRLPLASSQATFSRVQGFSAPPQLLDIGSPARSGLLERKDDSYVINGVGTDMWDSPDQFSFVGTSVDGNCSLIARLDSFRPGDPSAKAGLMIRENLTPDGQFISLVCFGEDGLRTASLQWRWGREGTSTRLSNAPTGALNSPVWMKLERRYSRIDVLANDTALFDPGEFVEVVGYAAKTNGKPLVVRADVHRSSREHGAGLEPGNWRPLLDLSRVNDGTGLWSGYDIFRLQGVVTFCGEVQGRRYWTFQDRSAAALVSPRDSSKLFDVPAGQMVEVFCNPGWHPPSPILRADNVFVLGPATLPTPIKHPAEYLLPNRGEGTWIEIDGIVRSVGSGGVLQVKSRGELFNVALPPTSEGTYSDLIDAEIRVRGAIVFPSETERLLLVPDRSLLEITTPAPIDPFALTPIAIQSMTGDLVREQSRHRVHVSGGVTYCDKGLVYLQDKGSAVRLEMEVPTDLELGASISAIGFPEWGPDHCLVLRNVSIRSSAAPAFIIPSLISLSQLQEASNAQRLVRVQGTVVAPWNGADSEFLELSDGQHLVGVSFPRGLSPSLTIPQGSVVEVTGVSSRDLPSSAWRPMTGQSIAPLFHVLSRSSLDLVVLQKPSMWVLQRTLIVASSVSVAALVLVAWIHLLRRRVRQRTEELASTMKKLQSEAGKSATLAERDRLAGEIHDSLEQGLNGIIFHLQCTATMDSCSEEVRDALNLACNMASFSRTEVQYAVWELQSPLLEDSDLLTAIRKISMQIAPASLCASVKVDGEVRRMPSTIEHHLLRIVQEALNNIVKHAKASRADVLLRYGSDHIELSVCDDGCGFTPSEVRIGGLGHFGLRSLRSRVTRINGVLTVQSSPGQGTSLIVNVPLAPT